eukprot:14016151-Alexandrium_andersonii.AAC.1
MDARQFRPNVAESEERRKDSQLGHRDGRRIVAIFRPESATQTSTGLACFRQGVQESMSVG